MEVYLISIVTEADWLRLLLETGAFLGSFEGRYLTVDGN